jgi:multicomponent Na+:H+ antiporter subunit C
MSQFTLYSVASMVLFSLSLYSFISYAHLLRKILALNVMSSAVFLFLINVAQRNRDEFPDPVPQAMVLTGIVVAVSATGFALALARRIYTTLGTVTLPDEEDLE